MATNSNSPAERREPLTPGPPLSCAEHITNCRVKEYDVQKNLNGLMLHSEVSEQTKRPFVPPNMKRKHLGKYILLITRAISGDKKIKIKITANTEQNRKQTQNVSMERSSQVGRKEEKISCLNRRFSPREGRRTGRH